MILWFSRVQHRVQPVHTPPARSDLWCCRLCGSLHSMICRWRRCRSHAHTHAHTSGESQSCSLSRSLRASLLFGLPTQANGGSFVLVLVHPIRMCWCVAAVAAGWANGSVASLRWILSRTILSKWKWNSETAREIFELKWIHQRQRQRQAEASSASLELIHISNVSRIVANQADIADVAD